MFGFSFMPEHLYVTLLEILFLKKRSFFNFFFKSVMSISTVTLFLQHTLPYLEFFVRM